MMRLPKFEYRSARTVEEALGWMGEYEGEIDKDPEAQAMLMAGGTDVLPNMKHRIFTPQVVVGLRAVSALHWFWRFFASFGSRFVERSR